MKKSALEFSCKPCLWHKEVNRNQIKYIAIFAMLLDHIAHVFSKFFLNYSWGFALCFVFRFFGRITAPVMCWFLVQGFIHTSSRKNYAIRLLIFTLVAQIPYSLVRADVTFMAGLSVIYTLLVSFLMLCVLESNLEAFPKWVIVIVLIVLSIFGDWAIFAPLMVLFFYKFREDRRRLLIFYSLACAMVVVTDIVVLICRHYYWWNELWQLGMFLFIPLYLLYNGEPGSRHPFHKWFFYAFYPLHLMVLWGISHLF